jgi:hypothetical protein
MLSLVTPVRGGGPVMGRDGGVDPLATIEKRVRNS